MYVDALLCRQASPVVLHTVKKSRAHTEKEGGCICPHRYALQSLHAQACIPCVQGLGVYPLSEASIQVNLGSDVENRRAVKGPKGIYYMYVPVQDRVLLVDGVGNPAPLPLPTVASRSTADVVQYCTCVCVLHQPKTKICLLHQIKAMRPLLHQINTMRPLLYQTAQGHAPLFMLHGVACFSDNAGRSAGYIIATGQRTCRLRRGTYS